MITRSQYGQVVARTNEFLRTVGIPLTDYELERLEVVDFGLNDLNQFGAQILTLVDTERIGVKLIISFPHQILPEHTHLRLGEYVGKEETVRCHWGILYLYKPGEPGSLSHARIPKGKENYFTVFSENILHPGQQVTLLPGTPHWFQAGPDGSVVWSFSTKAVDSKDHFTNPEIERKTVIVDDRKSLY